MPLAKDKHARHQHYFDSFAKEVGAGQAHTEQQRGQIAHKVLTANFAAAIDGYLAGDLTIEDLQADLLNLHVNAPLIGDFVKTGKLAAPIVG